MINSSFDDHPDFFSNVSPPVEPKTKMEFRELIRSSHKFIFRYFLLLPPIDHEIAKFYFIDSMTQDQISSLFNISQAAVSKRLKFIMKRLKFLLKMPSLNPIQVKEELSELFTPELFEFAYIFYWELAQNRVKFFIKTSQSGAANKFFKLMQYLEEVVKNKCVDEEKTDKEKTDKVERVEYLALIYLDYFRFIQSRSNIITFLCKKNDEVRSNSLIVGKSIMN